MSDLTIFLDIDGPLATENCYGVGTKNKWGYYLFNPKCVKVLNQIDDLYKPVWILSSSWRFYDTLLSLNEYFEFRKLNFKLSGFTPFGNNNKLFQEDELQRSENILDFVEKNSIKHFIVIDDLELPLIKKENLVSVGEEGGVGERGKLEEITSKINEVLGHA